MTTDTAIATTIANADRLEFIGFGPARSRSLAADRPEFARLAIAFADACKEKGNRFRVFKSSGRNGHYARLRLKVVTGKAPNRYTDSRGFEGPWIGMEVGALSTTTKQVAALTEAIHDLAEEIGVEVTA